MACGARSIAIDHLVDRASALFELRDGRVVAKSDVRHPRDPCADLDPITWLADLRTNEEKSVQRQEIGACDFIAKQGWSLNEAHIYTDDKKSGALYLGRPGFQNMLRDAAAGAFDVVVMFDLEPVRSLRTEGHGRVARTGGRRCGDLRLVWCAESGPVSAVID